MMYGNYAQQPELGYLTRREGILGTASMKVAANWVMTGAARWDLEANKVNQYIVGAGYVDDCFVLAANYVTSYNYSAGTLATGAQPCLYAADRLADPCHLGGVGRSAGYSVDAVTSRHADPARPQFEPVDNAEQYDA